MLLRSTTTKRKKALSKAAQTFLFAGEKDTAGAPTQTICSDDAAYCNPGQQGKDRTGTEPGTRTPRVWLTFLSNGQTGGYTLKCSLEVRVYFAHCGLHRAPLGLH